MDKDISMSKKDTEIISPVGKKKSNAEKIRMLENDTKKVHSKLKVKVYKCDSCGEDTINDDHICDKCLEDINDNEEYPEEIWGD